MNPVNPCRDSSPPTNCESVPRQFSIRFLAYDACCVQGRVCLADPLPKRLLKLRRDVLAPRFKAAHSGHDFSAEPFKVELKDFFSTKQLPHIFGQVATAGAITFRFNL